MIFLSLGLPILDLILQLFGLWWVAKRILGWRGMVSEMGLRGSHVSIWVLDRKTGREVSRVWVGAEWGVWMWRELVVTKINIQVLSTTQR